MEQERNIWSRFDFKAACLFTGYKERSEGLKKELDRVGLGDAQLLWQYPSPLDSVLRRQARGRNGLRQGFFSCGMGHYRAIKTAYELGAEHSLIMEDDVRFMKDIGLIREIVDDLPSNYDVALLDTFKPQRMSFDEWKDNSSRNKVSEHWCRFSNMRSFACYAMSRRGMARWISLWEGGFRPNGWLFICDQYMNRDRFGADMNMYYAVPNAAIQAPVGGAACSGQSGCHVDKYRQYGLDVDSYAIG